MVSTPLAINEATSAWPPVNSCVDVPIAVTSLSVAFRSRVSITSRSFQKTASQDGTNLGTRLTLTL